MDSFIVVLRIVHIVSAVLWVGGAALFFLYIEPTINKLGPDAEKFVEEAIVRRKAPIYFAVISTLAVSAGVALYWINWLPAATTPAGLTFGLGGIAALVAWLGGNLLIPKSLMAVGAIAAEIKAAGGPPSAELMGRMHAAQERLRRIGLADLILLSVAVVAMAIARYMN